jgi:putative hydrolase
MRNHEPDHHGQINLQVSTRLREMAGLLHAQGANPFRAGAYRKAADAVEALPTDIDALLDAEGMEGLIALPVIGRGIASAIEEMVRTGRWPQLDRLRGELDPEAVLQSVPGIGPRLARQLHDELHIDTLEALEAAAQDGRLQQVKGVGERRNAMIRASLAMMLDRPRRRARTSQQPIPPVQMLLDADRQYRRMAAAGELRKIAPRRFNPKREAWLPIMHAQHGPWHCTALYSNTARAHDLDRVYDWVTVYCHTDDDTEQQFTAVTESQGELTGKRVIRGREAECHAFYKDAASQDEGMPG